MPTSINQAGEVVGHSTSGASKHGFFFSNGAYSDLGPAADVYGLNDLRQVVGSILQPNSQRAVPALWDARKNPVAVEELPLPPGFVSGFAWSINNQGMVVGTCGGSAFIFDGTSSTDLNTVTAVPSGWHLTSATGINDSGQITGLGLVNGDISGFLLSPRFEILTSTVVGIVGILFGGIAVDAGGIVILPGGPIPVGPWGPLVASWPGLSQDKRDALIGLAIDQLAMYLADGTAKENIRREALGQVRTQIDALIASLTPVSAVTPSPRAGMLLRNGMSEFELMAYKGVPRTIYR